MLLKITTRSGCLFYRELLVKYNLLLTINITTHKNYYTFSNYY